jgi:hypothetical protein
MPNVVKPDERVYAVILPADLLREVKVRAATRGESMRAWLSRAVCAQLRRERPRR